MSRFANAMVLSVLICFLSCKADKPKVLGNDYAMLNQDQLKPAEITKMRAGAIAVLEHRYKENNKKSYTIMDKDIWVYEGTVKNSDLKPLDSLGGKWLDLKEDLTYTYGAYGDQTGSGRYDYDIEKGLLLMIDDNAMMKPQEFKIKALNDILVFEGSYLYKDNNLQAKLGRRSAKPAKGK
jgi:hypothetical protein